MDKSVESQYIEGAINTPLAKYLQKKKQETGIELSTSKLVKDFIEKEGKSSLKKVSPSQWGNIRNIASRSKSAHEIKQKLYEGKDAYLTHGVAYEKWWGENNGVRLNRLKSIISEVEQNSENGNKVDLRIFIAKFASEMAKAFKN